MLGQLFGELGQALILESRYTEPRLKNNGGKKMKCKEKLEEEVEFWLAYISTWEAKHNKPIPDRAKLLLRKAALKLEQQYPEINQGLVMKSDKLTIH